MEQNANSFGMAPFEIENILNYESNRLPFYVKRMGYVEDRRFIVDYSEGLGDILLLFSVNGVAQYSQGRILRYLNEDDLVITSCVNTIKFEYVSKGKWQFFYMIIGGSHAKLYCNLIRTQSNMMHINPMSGITEYFHKLSKLNYDGSLDVNLKAGLFLHSMLTELYEMSQSIIDYKQMVPVSDSDVNRAISYIKKNYMNNINVDDVCSKVWLSKYYFCKIFKKNTGVTLHQYINKFRMEKAKELLSYSKVSVAEVANRVGFNNSLTFIRCFKNDTGMTPGEYRNNF